MSGDSTGQVLGGTTAVTGVALLPATGDGSFIELFVFAVIAMGIIVLTSFTLSRLIRSLNK